MSEDRTIDQAPGARQEPSEEDDRLAKEVIGAAIEVHRQLGPGYGELFFENALAIELGLRGMKFERQRHFKVDYKGEDIGEGKVDILVGGRVILELKTADAVTDLHRAQTLSYQKALGLRLGLILNFKSVVMREGIHRVIYSPEGAASAAAG